MVTENLHQAEAGRWLVEHGDSLFRYAVSLVKDPAVAEELVQETLVSGLKSASRFKGKSSPSTWLMGILRHKVMDHYRSRGREKQFEVIDDSDLDRNLFDSNGHWAQPPSIWPPDPHQLLTSSEFQKVLDNCLDKLTEPKRAVILLRAFEGLSAEEICKELGITSTNLWVLVHRARATLRQCLDVNWFGAIEK